MFAVAAYGRHTLRRTSLAQPQHRFGGHDECEAAYNKLYDQCMPGAEGSGISKEPEYVKQPAKAKGGSGPQPAKAEAKPAYYPPEGRTGKPNEQNGWDYSKHGDDWGRFGECSGPNQSPIDIAKYVDIQGQTKYLLWFDYYLDPDLKENSHAQLVNDGHSLRYDVRGNRVDLGFVKIAEQEYEAAEYMFHAPSEHSMDGAVFPLELQIYNRAPDGKGIVAIAIFFREGQSNKFLAGLKDSLGEAVPSWIMHTGKTFGKLMGKFPYGFDLEAVIPKGDVSKEASFYNYQGSLTQPPCTAGVDWWVLSSPITATRDEIRFFRKAIFMSESMRHGNARSTQPLGDRRLFVGLTGFQHAIKGHKMPEWTHLDESKEPRGYSSHDMPWGPHWAGNMSLAAGPGAAPAAAAAPASA